MRKIPFSVQILLGLALGVTLGYVARTNDLSWLASSLDTVGGLFVQLLKLAVPPLVFTAIVVSVVSLRGVANAARLALRTLLWFGATALVAVSVGIGLGLLTNPGRGVTLDTAGAAAPTKTGSWTDFLTGIVPTNPVGAFVEGNVLQIVFLALVVGAAALLVGPPAEPFVELNRALLGIVQKALWWVIRLAPIGTLGLIGNAVATYGWDLLAPLARFTTAVYVGCAIVLFVVYPLLLVGAGRLNPVRFFAGAWPAIQLAFVSRSSVGTMPVTQRSVERLGVPREYASFAVPFGATTKMDGCAAIYPALAAIFVAQVFGVDLGVTDYLLIAFVSVVGSAEPGRPRPGGARFTARPARGASSGPGLTGSHRPRPVRFAPPPGAPVPGRLPVSRPGGTRPPPGHQRRETSTALCARRYILEGGRRGPGGVRTPRSCGPRPHVAPRRSAPGCPAPFGRRTRRRHRTLVSTP